MGCRVEVRLLDGLFNCHIYIYINLCAYGTKYMVWDLFKLICSQSARYRCEMCGAHLYIGVIELVQKCLRICTSNMSSYLFYIVAGIREDKKPIWRVDTCCQLEPHIYIMRGESDFVLTTSSIRIYMYDPVCKSRLTRTQHHTLVPPTLYCLRHSDRSCIAINILRIAISVQASDEGIYSIYPYAFQI